MAAEDMNQFELKLRQQHPLLLSLGIVISVYLSYFFISAIGAIFMESPFNSKNEELTLSFYIYLILFAPIIETVLFQIAPVKILNHFRVNKYIGCAISAVIFSLAHIPDYSSVLVAIPCGLIFTYVTYIKIEQIKQAFYSVAVAHLTINSVVSLLLYLNSH
jgi:hypothetical protein